MIDNALVEPERQLEVTEELAALLAIDGTVELECASRPPGGSQGPEALDSVRGHGLYVNQQTREGSRRRS